MGPRTRGTSYRTSREWKERRDDTQQAQTNDPRSGHAGAAHGRVFEGRRFERTERTTVTSSQQHREGRDPVTEERTELSRVLGGCADQAGPDGCPDRP